MGFHQECKGKGGGRVVGILVGILVDGENKKEEDCVQRKRLNRFGRKHIRLWRKRQGRWVDMGKKTYKKKKGMKEGWCKRIGGP